MSVLRLADILISPHLEMFKRAKYARGRAQVGGRVAVDSDSGTCCHRPPQDKYHFPIDFLKEIEKDATIFQINMIPYLFKCPEVPSMGSP